MALVEDADDVGTTAPDAGTQKAFARQSSGLVRLMGPGPALIYNTMATALILGAALTYLWVPYAFPGANLWLGALITGVFGATMMVAYSMLGSAMPRSGGDYVFQTRLLHPAVAFTLVFSSLVIWLGLWICLDGWFAAAIGISPFAATLGTQLNAPWLTDVGTWAASPWGITWISLACFAVAAWILIRGARLYLKIQPFLWASVILAFVICWVVLLANGNDAFVREFNAFLGENGEKRDYYGEIITAAKDAGYSQEKFSFWATLGVAPILWTVVAWAYWAIANAGELKGARRMRGMMVSTTGALAVNVITIAITAALLARTAGGEFLGSLGYLYYSGAEGLEALPAPPFFGIVVSFISGTPIVPILLAIGFTANAVAAVFAVAWGGSRIVLAMAVDRLLPERFSRVSERFHTPANAILLIFAISVVWVFLYNHTSVASYTLAATMTATLVFSASMIVAVIFPFRAKEIYRTSPAANHKILGLPAISVVGAIALAFNALILWQFFVNDSLFVNDGKSLLIILGVIVACAVYYYARCAWLRRNGYNPDLAFEMIPPE
jgi:APA family basic amino acid/polyamine antiporter